VLSAYLNKVLKDEVRPFQTTGAAPTLQNLESLILGTELDVLELGAGCGIVGLTLASHCDSEPTVQLTDLPEATSILDRNVTCYQQTRAKSKVNHQVLDWSIEQLPSNIASTAWNLILVADCTYNPDVVPDLVKTLKRITIGKSKEALICLAMKVRHESEMVFFDLMRDAGYGVIEKGKVILPVLGDEQQEIEIFVYKDERNEVS
jgi:predicted nicotinamide N-methyase